MFRTDLMAETQHVLDESDFHPLREFAPTPPPSPDMETGKIHQEHHMTVNSIRQDLVEMKYAVRGAVVAKAEEMKRRLQAGEQLPFKEIILCNVGNPHAVQQKPVTFYRQVLACCTYPELCEAPSVPVDVKVRAQEYLEATGGKSIGAYTGSTGLKVVREQIADFIERRDGFPSDPEAIALHTGASEGIKNVIQALIAKKGQSIMIPMPQYPLYSASLTMFGGTSQYYCCNEELDWSVTREELDRSYEEGTQNCKDNVRAIAVINPGNPTGSVLSLEDVKMFITFARDKGIPILADEVYQANVYTEGKKFHSFKKVLRMLQEMDDSYKAVQLISFHSASKGILGECGLRGGYTEFVGIPDDVFEMFVKVASTSLSSSTLGQICCGLMVKPPEKGQPSYDLFDKEANVIFNGMKKRAKLLTQGLNAIPGITCREIEGAMYAFAKLDIPEKAVKHAAQQKMAADEFWCLELVEKTGIVCVPGSGFGQEPGTFHFRLTILPPMNILENMLAMLKTFQMNFQKTWSSNPSPTRKSAKHHSTWTSGPSPVALSSKL
jgi:alanine transaminase